MKRLISVLVLALLATGCAAAATTACAGPVRQINICVNGKRMQFDERHLPHRHETGNLYAPVEPLARTLKLDLRMIIRGDGQSAIVTVNGRPFSPAMASDAKGVHVHEGQVYLPLRELAATAGLRLDMDAESGTAGFAR